MANPAPNPMPPAPTARVYLASTLSGVLLWASFFPLSLGFLAWVALVPWLTLVRAETTNRRRYFAAWVGGLLFSLAALQWVRVAHPMMYFAWIGLSIWSSLWFLLALWLIRWLDRVRIPLWLSVPAVWVSLEYIRAHFPIGFPWLEPTGVYHMSGFAWYFLGYSQHDYLPLIQIADLTGVYGVSFLIAAGNGLLVEGLLRLPALDGVRRWLFGSSVPEARASLTGPIIVSALVIATLAYGFIRLGHPAFADGPHVALLQGNLPQNVKMMRGATMAQHFIELCDQAVAPPQGEPKPDLIVWPETSCPDDWYDPIPGLNVWDIPARFQRDRLELASGVTTKWHSNMLLGLNVIECDRDQAVAKFNSAVLVGANGIPAARYDKMHLVPFGEYVPMGSVFPWLQMFTPYKGNYSCEPGRQRTRFVLDLGERQYRFGVVICYEDTDPSMARHYAVEERDGAPADFVVNISNDGWFDGSSEHEEHLAICRFRAIESRRPVIRAVNMGISAIIDGDGRVVKLPGESWAKSKKVMGVVRGTVPLDGRESWYARLGDWLPLACWGLLAAGLILPRLTRRSVPT